MNLRCCNRLTWTIPVAAGLVSLFVAGSASACEALRPPLRDMAKQLAGLLEGRNEHTIAVGAFTGPVRRAASAGPGLKQILIEELEKITVEVKRKGERQKVKIRVESRAKFEVRGDYGDVEDTVREVLKLQLTATVLDTATRKRIVELEREIDDRAILAQVLGVTRPDFGGLITPKVESKRLKESMNNPRVDLRKGEARIKTDPKSKYGIEIYVKKGGDYVAREAHLGRKKAKEEECLAYVPLKKNEVFGVKLINDSDFDAAVELTLDGLSMFAFSENRNYRFVIVPKRSSLLVRGWHRTNKLSEEFVITNYAKSAVKELLADPDGIGTITATFGAAWHPKEEPPLDDSATPREIGRKDPIQVTWEAAVRVLGRVRDVISVRYQKASAN
jgi:hypothetical protein